MGLAADASAAGALTFSDTPLPPTAKPSRGARALRRTARGACLVPAARMTINSLYIFSKRGTCLYYAEWARPVNTLKDTPEEDRKLMFGFLFSLTLLMNKMSPVQ